MRPTIFALLFSLGLFALGASPDHAHAAPPPAHDDASTANATASFTAGLQQYDAENWSAALPLFRQAWKSSRSPNARLYIALCLRKLGQLPAAYDEMAATVRQATALAEKTKKYARTREAAANQLALLEPLVAKVVIALEQKLPRQTLTLNGTTLPADKLGVPITVMPGQITVSAQAPGRQPVSKGLTLKGGQTKSVALRFGPALEKADDATTEATTGGGLRIAGYVVAGVGVASMVVFGITTAMANNEFDTLEQECGGQLCTDPAYADVVDRGKVAEIAASVTLATGLAALVGGGLMIIFGGPDDAEPMPADVGLLVTPRAGLLSLSGTF